MYTQNMASDPNNNLTVVHDILTGYKRMRILVGLVITIVALGCATGIFAVKHEATVRVHQQCWSRYNNSAILLALVNKAGQRFNTAQINDPQLRQILVVSQVEGQKFKKFANKTISIPKCVGNNPNPLPPQIKQIIKQG